ncbi:glycosyltransferase family 2 protein [bacterium]|nr:glycosyltransferase family 2 protein [bacterium]
MKHDISIIMPAFNEEACIYENIRKTREIMFDTGLSAEIVAVDDGSADDTLGEIRRAASDFDNVTVARNIRNMGKGMALRSGFERSTGDIVVFLDADLDIDPSQIRSLVTLLEETPCDIVVTSKHHPESKLRYPFSRKIASWIYYFMIRYLFSLPVRDTQTGLKVFRRKVLDDVLHRLLVKKFAYDVELLATAVRFGYRLREVPVVIEFKRDLKWGRIRIEDVISLFIDTLAVFYRLKVMRYYDGDRPRFSPVRKKVLVVVRGCPPSPEVTECLKTYDGTRIACIGNDAHQGESADYTVFRTELDVFKWLSANKDSYDILGFLGSNCLPMGVWVDYAVSNFDDSEVSVVCGPLIPGGFKSRLEKAAGMVFSSGIVRGSDAYLYSFRPVRHVHRASMENVFIRAEVFFAEHPENHGFTKSGGFFSTSASSLGNIQYDPDVAVLKKVPSLFMPYIRSAAREAFSCGYGISTGREGLRNLWRLVFTIIWTILLAGWAVLPSEGYTMAWYVYGAVVILTALACFDLLSTPFFTLGIVCDHFIRAWAFPAGLIKGIFTGAENRKRGGTA